jgi:hypothetical protein
VFFRIQNVRNRNAAVTDLLHRKQRNTYDVFWNSFVKFIGVLDGRRNKIVHWGTVVYISADHGSTKYETRLRAPDIWDRKGDQTTISLADLYDFIVRCDFAARLLNTFWVFISGQAAQIREAVSFSATWQEIFQQRVIYPPPDTHPLSQNPKES